MAIQECHSLFRHFRPFKLRNWGIPLINLSEIKDPEKIGHEIKKIKPKVILASIEDITQEEIQTELQLLDISYVAVDECQVSMFHQCHHC